MATNTKISLDELVEDLPPPNDFRQISIYPSPAEILNPTLKPYLRKNLIQGRYDDVEHYLDVHFRLLREDFIAPLRQGIAIYRDTQKADNIAVHPRVVFLAREIGCKGTCYRLKMPAYRHQNDPKSFMFGALLCFTHDNFASIFLAKVAQSEVRDLRRGEVIVGFDAPLGDHVCLQREYLMVECGVYFEPYFQVLTQLQRFHTSTPFPMEKYIVSAESEVRKAYLRSSSEILNIRGKLNASQARAFSAALSQDLSIVQGPPGTGKTHLALKVVKALLLDQRSWYGRSPMLVICLTNHALDQFLEGVTEFTDKVVRVGGQSKNTNMDRFNLKNHRERPENKDKRSVEGRILHDVITKVNHTKSIIMQLSSFDGILVDFSFMKEIGYDVEEVWFYKKSPIEIINWLLDSSLKYEVKDKFITNKINNRIKKEMNSGSFMSMKNLRYIKLLVERECATLKKYISNKPNLKAQFELELDEKKEQVLLLDYYIKNLKGTLEDMKTYSWKEIDETAFTKLLRNPHTLSVSNRRLLYHILLYKYKVHQQTYWESLDPDYQNAQRAYDIYRERADIDIMKKNEIIGMTTTSSARLHSILEELKSPIVLVEEAAEVLEAHIVAALTRHCKQLILIGDHKQLRPSPADHQLETKYRLGISLFERMINNNIQCYTLDVQHRMRPEIAALITPAIYPDLHNHESVLGRDLIRGVDSPLYFINHHHRENSALDTSKRNVHEADFLLAFARHLLLNGYERGEVAILATYLGQKGEIQRRAGAFPELDGVRIDVVDNYQGEESKIVLLSLVRNNDDGRIGFLATENRVCVALSRARDALYIMGNMAMLSARSALWKRVRKRLAEGGNIGSKLRLRCAVHSEETRDVDTAEGFPERGGCDKICGEVLGCGHKCPSNCHAADRKHIKDYKCSLLVKIRLKCKHIVTMKCHERHSYTCVVEDCVTLNGDSKANGPKPLPKK